MLARFYLVSHEIRYQSVTAAVIGMLRQILSVHLDGQSAFPRNTTLVDVAAECVPEAPDFESLLSWFIGLSQGSLERLGSVPALAEPDREGVCDRDGQKPAGRLQQ
jgi:hypothetical protein